MTTPTPVPIRPRALPAPPPTRWLSGRALVGWWVLSAAILLAFVGRPPVQRTQEARVLETAREMLEADWRQWLIPQLNGELRLRKPPLAYWIAAAGFVVGSVSETSGRVPTVLAGWLTLGVTFLAGRMLFGQRAGFFAAAALLGSYLFFRHTRLAETDAPAMLFVTCGVYAILRAAGEWELPLRPVEPLPPEPGGRLGYGRRDPLPRPVPVPGHSGWLHAAAASSALAFMAKGAPGMFPLLFLLAFAAVARRWDLVRRFLTRGAVLTVLVLGASWYAYAATVSGAEEFVGALRTLGSGEDHGRPFHAYFLQVPVATAPWSGLVVLGLIETIRRWAFDLRARTLLAWVGCIFLPMLVARNKQFHYLMPLMPPLMILAGWMVAVACEKPDEETGWWGRFAFRLTVIGTAVGVLALPWVARHESGRVRPADLLLTASLVAAVVLTAACRRVMGRAAGAGAYAGGCAAAMAVLVGAWHPSLAPHDARTAARDLKARFPNGPYYFYRGDANVPLCFNLRSEIPWVWTPEHLSQLAAANPDLTVISVTKRGRRDPDASELTSGPVRFAHAGRVLTERQEFNLYRLEKVERPNGGLAARAEDVAPFTERVDPRSPPHPLHTTDALGVPTGVRP